MATFGGFELGQVTTCAVVPNPVRWQINQYAGVDGRSRLHLGADGGRVYVDGVVHGATLSQLTSFFNQLYAWQRQGSYGAVVDNESATVPNCVLHTIEPDPAGIKRAADGGFVRRYRLIFEYDDYTPPSPEPGQIGAAPAPPPSPTTGGPYAPDAGPDLGPYADVLLPPL